MTRRGRLLLLLPMLIPLGLRAQASEFGIRGLGQPGRQESARALASGGGFGWFDGESSLNPAALSTLSGATALFTFSGDYRSTTNPAGTLSGRDTRFPQVLIAGPIPHRRFSLGVGYSLYTDRDFTVATDGVASPRGIPIPVHDTLSSRGGIDDLRLAVSWTGSSRFAIGGSIDFLTGSNRLAARRFWEDTSYTSPQQLAELSYSGVGASIGVVWEPVRRFQLAATYRHDGRMTVQRDSNGAGPVFLANTVVGHVDLPNTFAGAARYTAARTLTFSAAAEHRTWSAAQSSLIAQGAVGARNTDEFNFGFELTRDLRRPYRYPLRAGVRYATLPFLLDAGTQPHETSVSIGTGRRFAQERGGFDLAIEHVWRSQGAAYHESATLLTFGISVRPGGLTP